MVEGHILTANTNQHQHHPAWPLLSREDAEREAIDFTEQDHLATAALQASGIKKRKEISYPWQEEVKLRNLEACFSVLHSQALHTTVYGIVIIMGMFTHFIAHYNALFIAFVRNYGSLFTTNNERR